MFHVEHASFDTAIEVDRLAGQTRWSACFQPSPPNPERLDRFRQVARGRLICPPGWPLFAANVNQAVQKRPGRDHQRPAAVNACRLRAQARQPAGIEHDPAGAADDPVNLGSASSAARTQAAYRGLSACARGDHTAGPRLRLRSLNCIPVASIARPINPPSASISRTRCPLAVPPTAGLQGMCATVSRLSVHNPTLRPNRAAAHAASTPAWPEPTTITSNSLIIY